MKRISSQHLDKVAAVAAAKYIRSRFRNACRHSAFLEGCLSWQEQATPRPGVYFRWHLPRLLTTIDSLLEAADASNADNILDLAAYAPFSLLLEKYCQACGYKSHWVRTSRTGGTEAFEVAGERVAMPTERVDLNDRHLPFADGQFDIVLFTETIEHLDFHPHSLLIEINRVLRLGGLVLVTTPNITSWKKVLLLSDGEWQFDSPTFAGEWGHRFEYSFYQLRQLLLRSGFEPIQEAARDVYFDDPIGLSQAIQFASLLAGKVLTGRVSQVAKLLMRRGSGLFFVYRKVLDSSTILRGQTQQLVI